MSVLIGILPASMTRYHRPSASRTQLPTNAPGSLRQTGHVMRFALSAVVRNLVPSHL